MNTYFRLYRYPLPVYGVLFLMAGSLLAGCFGAYGDLRSDPSVTLQFKEVRVPDGYRYFYNGRKFMPYAVVGIDPDIRFNSRMWSPVDPKGEDFKRMLDFMYDQYRGTDPMGAEILDPQGKRVGIWYSTYRHTAVKIEKDGSLSVLSPYVPKRRGGGPF